MDTGGQTMDGGETTGQQETPRKTGVLHGEGGGHEARVLGGLPGPWSCRWLALCCWHLGPSPSALGGTASTREGGGLRPETKGEEPRSEVEG